MKKELRLTDIRKNLPFRVSGAMAIDIIGSFVEERYFQLDFDCFLPTKGMNLQRGLVWTLEQKQELILSVLKGIKIPWIWAIQIKKKDPNEKTILQIIDGKQRLTTLISFYKNEFPINVNGEDYLFSELGQEAQWAIEVPDIECRIAYEYHDEPISDADKILWFEMINYLGTPQDIEHIKQLKTK